MAGDLRLDRVSFGDLTRLVQSLEALEQAVEALFDNGLNPLVDLTPGSPVVIRLPVLIGCAAGDDPDDDAPDEADPGPVLIEDEIPAGQPAPVAPAGVAEGEGPEGPASGDAPGKGAAAVAGVAAPAAGAGQAPGPASIKDEIPVGNAVAASQSNGHGGAASSQPGSSPREAVKAEPRPPARPVPPADGTGDDVVLVARGAPPAAPKPKWRNGEAWEPDEDRRMQELLAGGMPMSEVAALLGRTTAAAYVRNRVLLARAANAAPPASPPAPPPAGGFRSIGEVAQTVVERVAGSQPELSRSQFLLAAWIEDQPRPSDWTAQQDLELVEGVTLGRKLVDLADRGPWTVTQLRERWQTLTRELRDPRVPGGITLAVQADLLAAVRHLAGAAAA